MGFVRNKKGIVNAFGNPRALATQTAASKITTMESQLQISERPHLKGRLVLSAGFRRLTSGSLAD